ncbi:MAG: aminotransferase, partial [Cyclobacteriaceae bacterium]
MTDQEIQNLDRWRADTPGVQKVIHFNNAGSSLMPSPVIKAVKDYLEEEISFGGYETATKYHNQLEKTYQFLAQLIHADVEEVAILENATAAWRQAFLS